MLTFTVVWLMLAATVTLLAMKRKSAALEKGRLQAETKVSGKAWMLVAAIYSLALLAGFLCLSKFFIAGLWFLS